MFKQFKHFKHFKTFQNILNLKVLQLDRHKFSKHLYQGIKVLKLELSNRIYRPIWSCCLNLEKVTSEIQD